jgi:phosphatidylserine decarboxylase
MKIAKEGYPLILSGAALTIVAAAAGWKFAGALLGLASLAVAGFFRDPDREIPAGDGLVVSPADGKVVSIANLPNDSRFAEAATRVSIFLSPLDVHINRMPIGGKIEEVQYRPGKFLAAYKEEASEQNEQNAVKVIDENGRLFGVVQIAGVVARRIVCSVKPGEVLRRGDRFGLIMFGSRTDLYLPQGCTLEISEGQRVKGGATIVGRFV